MKISIVTTLYYSANYLDDFYRRCLDAVRHISHDYEFVMVNDGSPDDSVAAALRLREQDSRVRLIDLSRNFGHHRAMMIGLQQARGDLVFLIDCDLEEPPEMLPTFYETMQQDQADVVYGVQEERTDHSFSYRLMSAAYYRIFNMLTHHSIPRDLLTMRLMTRRYVDALIVHQERVFVISGLWAATGFKQVSIVVNKGYKGHSTYNFGKRMNTLIYSVVAFSNKPLIYISVLGLLLTIPSILYVIYIVLQQLQVNVQVRVDGWTSLIVSLWFLSGLIIFILGIIATYISVIFTEVKARPYAIIRQIYDSPEQATMTDQTPAESGQTQETILAVVNQYYSDKIRAHGNTHAGVDWNSKESQELRFEQFKQLYPDTSEAFSVLDYGCGYGAMAHYLQAQGYQFSYTGYDISQEMIAAARQQNHPESWQFTTDATTLPASDFVIASGIFNVRFDVSSDDWHAYMLETIQTMWQHSQRGIAFNVLTSYSDEEYMRDDLYYADPLFWFDYCKRHFSRQVTLLHDYGLYEFTLLMRADNR